MHLEGKEFFADPVPPVESVLFEIPVGYIHRNRIVVGEKIQRILLRKGFEKIRLFLGNARYKGLQAADDVLGPGPFPGLFDNRLAELPLRPDAPFHLTENPFLLGKAEHFFHPGIADFFPERAKA